MRRCMPPQSKVFLLLVVPVVSVLSVWSVAYALVLLTSGRPFAGAVYMACGASCIVWLGGIAGRHQ